MRFAALRWPILELDGKNGSLVRGATARIALETGTKSVLSWAGLWSPLNKECPLQRPERCTRRGNSTAACGPAMEPRPTVGWRRPAPETAQISESADCPQSSRKASGTSAASALRLTIARKTLISACFALGLAATTAYALAPLKSLLAPASSDQLGELLRNRIEAAGVPPKITVGAELIHASMMLPLFYERRAYRPAWSGDEGPLGQADALVRAIREAGDQGLRPRDYHLLQIESLLAEVRRTQKQKDSLNPSLLVDLDLLLSDAFLIYGSHLLEGCINPETIDPEWFANRRKGDLADVLQAALDSGRIGEELRGLLPPQTGYAKLRESLARYRHLVESGGWPVVPDGPPIAKGCRGERVVALRARLISTGDLDRQDGAQGDLFNDTVDQSVRRFQWRHGLDADGIVGPETLAALNTPAEQRVRQIELNLERWRWLPQDLGRQHVLVNIANFELEVIEDDAAVMAMRAVVGKEYHRTPVFSDKITYLVFNPTWHVPHLIAIRDKLPLIRNNPDYLAEQKMIVLQGWGSEAKQIGPRSIDWTKLTPQNFKYRLRQEPGPNNALGPIKFMFPNRFNVYLHDTPSKDLFEKTERSFSSGCIRIEKPIELAEYVLRPDQKWTRQGILAAIEGGVEQTVRLPEPIPIHLLYWTAWADDNGTVHFRRDIYGRDQRLDEALRREPPSP